VLSVGYSGYSSVLSSVTVAEASSNGAVRTHSLRTIAAIHVQKGPRVDPEVCPVDTAYHEVRGGPLARADSGAESDVELLVAFEFQLLAGGSIRLTVCHHAQLGMVRVAARRPGFTPPPGKAFGLAARVVLASESWPARRPVPPPAGHGRSSPGGPWPAAPRA
jgi:hypothetical protein